MSICRIISCIVGRGCLLWPARSLGKTVLAFALLHFVPRDQTCLLLQISLDFLLFQSSPLWWKCSAAQLIAQAGQQAAAQLKVYPSQQTAKQKEEKKDPQVVIAVASTSYCLLIVSLLPRKGWDQFPTKNIDVWYRTLTKRLEKVYYWHYGVFWERVELAPKLVRNGLSKGKGKRLWFFVWLVVGFTTLAVTCMVWTSLSAPWVGGPSLSYHLTLMWGKKEKEKRGRA